MESRQTAGNVTEGFKSLTCSEYVQDVCNKKSKLRARSLDSQVKYVTLYDDRYDQFYDEFFSDPDRNNRTLLNLLKSLYVDGNNILRRSDDQ